MATKKITGYPFVNGDVLNAESVNQICEALGDITKYKAGDGISITNGEISTTVINDSETDTGKTWSSEKLSSELEERTNYISVTYNELVSLVDESKLIPGCTYRLTDFITTTSISNTRSAGHQFDLLMMADDTNVLNENVRAINHETDDYFVESPIRYHVDGSTTFTYVGTIDVDGTTYYKWETDGGTYSGIYYILTLQREYTNTVSGTDDDGDYYLTAYPFDGFMSEDDEMVEPYERWLSKSKKILYTEDDDLYLGDSFLESIESYQSGVKPQLSSWELKYCLYNDTDRFAWVDTNGKGVIYWLKDEYNNEAYYDFKNIQFKRWAITDITSTGIDDSVNDVIKDLKGELVYSQNGNRCFGIITGDSQTPTNISYNNVTITFDIDSDTYEWYYTFGSTSDLSLTGGCHDNKIGHNSTPNNIVFGGGCYSNVLGDDCINNTFGNN